MQWLDDLNDAQRAAVTADDGSLLIVAGPGTGKTKTLAARIVHLIAEGRAQPEQVLALTFTKKAAEEMQARVRMLLGKAAQVPRVSTFHALCHDILGGGQSFVADNDRLHMIKALPRPEAYKRYTAREMGLLISRFKNQAEHDGGLAAIVAAYDAALAAAEYIDFDDLLVHTKQLLEHDEAVRREVQARYTHILVDEFQDTNMLQYELLQLLRGHDNLFVIGDPNQSIYGFRGASGSIFGQFRADFPGHTEVALTVNYRSTPEAVRAGNAIFSDSPQLRAHRNDTGIVRAVEVFNEYSEANWIVDTIHRAVGGGDFLHAVSDNDRADEYTLKDFAVIYRNRSAAAASQKTIAHSGLPYQVVGEGSPYEQPQVQLVLAVLRAYASDRSAPEGMDHATWHAMCGRLAQEADQSPAALAHIAAGMLGDAATVSMQQCIGMLVRHPSVPEALAYIGAIREQGFYDPDADAVTLLTIHASKGLEFPHVFIIGAEEGILPYVRADPDEERRLWYVALTRARDHADVLHTQRRSGEPSVVSPFIKALPPEVLPRTVDPQLAADRRRAQKRAAKRSQQTLF
jgi:superfamily I DNA/RNA helicase